MHSIYIFVGGLWWKCEVVEDVKYAATLDFRRAQKFRRSHLQTFNRNNPIPQLLDTSSSTVGFLIAKTPYQISNGRPNTPPTLSLPASPPRAPTTSAAVTEQQRRHKIHDPIAPVAAPTTHPGVVLSSDSTSKPANIKIGEAARSGNRAGHRVPAGAAHVRHVAGAVQSRREHERGGAGAADGAAGGHGFAAGVPGEAVWGREGLRSTSNLSGEEKTKA